MSGEIELWSLARRSVERINTQDMAKIGEFNEQVMRARVKLAWATDYAVFAFGRRIGLPAQKILEIPDSYSVRANRETLDDDLKMAHRWADMDPVPGNALVAVSDVLFSVGCRIMIKKNHWRTETSDCIIGSDGCPDPEEHIETGVWLLRQCDGCGVLALGERDGSKRVFHRGEPLQPIYVTTQTYGPSCMLNGSRYPWRLHTSSRNDIEQGIGERLAAPHSCYQALPEGSPAPPPWAGAGAGPALPPRAASPGQGPAPSPIEKVYWDAHQSLQLPELWGLQREYVTGHYRLDFALPQLKIAVELDGFAWHSSPQQFIKDRQRQRDLEMDGWRVIRFAGAEVNRAPQACVLSTAAYVRRYQGNG